MSGQHAATAQHRSVLSACLSRASEGVFPPPTGSVYLPAISFLLFQTEAASANMTSLAPEARSERGEEEEEERGQRKEGQQTSADGRGVVLICWWR